MHITISNDGPLLTGTNYFETPHAGAGYMYLSGNAGAWRLLVPPAAAAAAEEMATASFVTLAYGSDEDGQRVVDITFDDGSDAPFVLRLDARQVDRALTPGPGVFLVYAQGPTAGSVRLLMERTSVTRT